ncbi:MAG TPA: helix-turn-helix domain-containing GNAT family N-acetyltransferase [Roseiarcus sp.]|nr:helix-turn-helix domain-containing GNAT family N-acetyltransferase [Roseiarcus sp.]
MDGVHIQQVRRFNRLITARVGALEESYLRRGRPLGEARLIFEIGRDEADIRRLREKLGLDSGYLSRLMRSLEAQNLVRVGKQAQDGRRRRARLTAKGRAELAAYDKLSDDLAESILAPLSLAERDRLLAAMAEVERLLHAGAIEIRIEASDSEDGRWCLDQYFEELARRFENGFDPAKSNPAADEEMTPPSGCFVIARRAGRPIGCGALKRKTGAIGEIKRMWTAPDARGQGVARRVLQRLEDEAQAFGLKTLRLETNRMLKEAQALYRAQGYVEVAPFNDEPYAHHWYEKRL